MTLIYLILPITFLIAAGFVAAFVWAAWDGQFDDLTTPRVRAIFREPDGGESSIASHTKPPAADHDRRM